MATKKYLDENGLTTLWSKITEKVEEEIAANAVTVDEELDENSTNPVQNKVITKALDAMTSISYSVVDNLPEEGEDGVIYLTKKDTEEEEENNYYDEWIWENHTFEKIGDTKVDLSDYATHDEVTEEASAREAKDTELQEEIDKEVAAREAKDTELQENLNKKLDASDLVSITDEEINGICV